MLLSRKYIRKAFMKYNIQINEEYLAQDTLMKYGSDHKPEYAVIRLY